jgi:hypothetical protein
VQAVNVVDLFRCEHRQIVFIRAELRRDHDVVLYKIPAGPRQLFGKPGLRKKLRCSLQDRPFPAQQAKPLLWNALGPELHCSLQDW